MSTSEANAPSSPARSEAMRTASGPRGLRAIGAEDIRRALARAVTSGEDGRPTRDDLGEGSMSIKVYGATWCPDCRRAKKFLTEQRLEFEWHDIEAEPEGVSVVEQRNNGNHTIPTIIFDDDTHLAEPSNEELADKLRPPRQA